MLKKVWWGCSSLSNWKVKLINNNNNRNKSQNRVDSDSDSDSKNALDKIPDDIIRIIIRKVGPKEAAKLCLVCRGWKHLITSDHLLWINFFSNSEYESDCDWDSVCFSESHLLTPSSPRLCNSLISIYGLRTKVPGALIADAGAGYCKFGWSKYPRPSARSATFLEFGNIEAPMYSRLRHFYKTIYDRMQVKASKHPLVVSIPISHSDDTESARQSRRQLKEAIYNALFDINVPAVCAISQATLALFAARRTSGIVVNIGFHQTCVVPILHGKIMRKVGVETVGLGAIKLTGFLREQMQQRNIYFESLYTVRELKENLCYVAYDYDAEFSKDTQASYEVSREGLFSLSKERFQTGEILFQPRIAGVRAMGVHQAIALCMDHCHAAELADDDGWFKTVVLSGGTACLPGLAQRVEKELDGLLPEYMSSGITVISPPHGADSAWHGARLISNLSTFPGRWCMTKDEFRRKSKRNRIGSW